MATRKSKTFAVLPNTGALDVFFLWREQQTEDPSITLDGSPTWIGQQRKDLKWQQTRTPWPTADRDKLIELLSKAGLTVRYFDPEEKKWMEQSLSAGLQPAPGTGREPSWTVPTLEEFERDYLQAK